MVKQGTYNELLSIRNDINRNVASSPSYAFFFSEKIKNFYKLHAMDLNLAQKKVAQMINEFVEHEEVDGESKPVLIDGENGEKEYKYKSEEARKEFSEQYEAFMKRGIKIHC